MTIRDHAAQRRRTRHLAAVPGAVDEPSLFAQPVDEHPKPEPAPKPAAVPCPAELRDPAAAARVAALTRRCPWCGAGPGSPCHAPATGRQPAGRIHPARMTPTETA